jgi:lipopolysaccharide/colanic/teichoic acid biosynthesis glycosyltransferase
MYTFSKRVLDLLLATIALLLLSPILIPVIIGLKLTGEGHIFYRQTRVGYKNVYFYIFKFATMVKNSPDIGTGTITMRNDPRVTPMGTFLRKTKINELPQIINVIKGDMSIVGPRPVDVKAFEAYSPEIQAKIYNAKPGITGIGSIIFRNEEELISNSSLPPYEYYKQFIAPYKGNLEMWYQEHKSLWNDILLIFLTAWSIMFTKSTIINRVFNNLPKRHF